MLSCNFFGFLSFFGTLAHIGAHTFFGLLATWQKTLFGIDYCVEVFIIVNRSHMQETTCSVAI